MTYSLSAIGFALAGAAVGATQARLLARQARMQRQPALAALRMALVAFVLVFAARAGQLLPCAAGWFAGLAVMGVSAYRALAQRSTP